MVERIIGLVCSLLCSFPFVIISKYGKDGREPINFWSGDKTLKEKVKDIKNYNIEMASLYKRVAIFFQITGIVFLIFPVVGCVLIVGGSIIGIYPLFKSYKKFLEKYS